MDPQSIVHERATRTLMLWRCLQQTLGRIVTCSHATRDKMWFTRLSKISRLLPAGKLGWGRDRERNAQEGLTEMTKNYSISQMNKWTTSVPKRELKLEKEIQGEKSSLQIDTETLKGETTHPKSELQTLGSGILCWGVIRTKEDRLGTSAPKKMSFFQILAVWATTPRLVQRSNTGEKEDRNPHIH